MGSVPICVGRRRDFARLRAPGAETLHAVEELSERTCLRFSPLPYTHANCNYHCKHRPPSSQSRSRCCTRQRCQIWRTPASSAESEASTNTRTRTRILVLYRRRAHKTNIGTRPQRNGPHADVCGVCVVPRVDVYREVRVLGFEEFRLLDLGVYLHFVHGHASLRPQTRTLHTHQHARIHQHAHAHASTRTRGRTLR